MPTHNITFEIYPRNPASRGGAGLRSKPRDGTRKNDYKNPFSVESPSPGEQSNMQSSNVNVPSSNKKIDSPWRSRAYNIGITLLLGSSPWQVGCVSNPVNNTVPAFAHAVTEATENSRSAFELADQKFGDVAAARLVVNYGKEPFKPDGRWHLISRAELQVRFDLLDALRVYATTLQELSGNSQLGDFDGETKKLGQSLLLLSKTDSFGKLTTESTAAAAGTSVNALGHWFIDSKRNTALKEAIAPMQEHVEQIANLLIGDIGIVPDEQGKGGHGLRATLWNTYTQGMIQQIAFIDGFKEKFDPVTFHSEVTKLAQMITEREKADITLAQTSETLKALVKAHGKLLKAIDTKTDVLSEIEVLFAEGKRLKSYYESLLK